MRRPADQETAVIEKTICSLEDRAWHGGHIGKYQGELGGKGSKGTGGRERFLWLRQGKQARRLRTGYLE